MSFNLKPVVTAENDVTCRRCDKQVIGECAFDPTPPIVGGNPSIMHVECAAAERADADNAERDRRNHAAKNLPPLAAAVRKLLATGAYADGRHPIGSPKDKAWKAVVAALAKAEAK